LVNGIDIEYNISKGFITTKSWRNVSSFTRHQSFRTLGVDNSIIEPVDSGMPLVRIKNALGHVQIRWGEGRWEESSG